MREFHKDSCWNWTSIMNNIGIYRKRVLRDPYMENNENIYISSINRSKILVGISLKGFQTQNFIYVARKTTVKYNTKKLATYFLYELDFQIIIRQSVYIKKVFDYLYHAVIRNVCPQMKQ